MTRNLGVVSGVVRMTGLFGGIDRFHQVLERLADTEMIELIVPDANTLADLIRGSCRRDGSAAYCPQ